MGKEKNEEFLSRWSRRKRESEQAVEPKTEAPAPVVPPVDQLTTQSDFSGFMHPKVEDALRRVALKKLFSDPHFNIPDPYEAYSGDWTGGEAIPEAMLASLEQMKTLVRKPPVEAPAEAPPEEAARKETALNDDKPQSDEPGKQDT